MNGRSAPLLWPVLVATLVPAALVLISATPELDSLLWFLWVVLPIVPIAWACAAIAALFISVVAARRAAWRRAASAAVLPLIVAVAFSTHFSTPIRMAGDELRFALARGNYLAEVATLAPSDEPHLKVWNWGGFIFSRGVVYDESDEIAAPTQSLAWKERAKTSELSCGFGFRPKGDHLYRVWFHC
jgi:hypothetical protein